MCTIYQATKNSYLRMSNVYPTYKGIYPFQFLSVDLIEIRDKDETIFKYVLSVICNYSKNPELIVLKNKSSKEVALSFKNQVILRYGSPLVVRSDGGLEF